MLESPPPSQPGPSAAPPPARAIFSDQPGGPQGLTAFHYLAIAAAAVGLLGLIKSIARTRIYTKLREANYESREDLISSLNSIEHLFAPLILAALITVAVVLFKLVRRSESGRGKQLATAALVLTALIVTLRTGFYLSFVTKSFWLMEVLGNSTTADLLITLLYIAGPIALLLFLNHGRQASGVVLAGLISFIVLGIAAAAHLISPPKNAGPWRWVLVDAVPSAIGYTCIAITAWASRFRGYVSSSSQRTGAHAGDAWLSSHAGLHAYSNALTWRLVLTLVGYGLLFLALKGRSIPLLKFMSWSLPLMTLITGTLMTVGVFRYANQPLSSRGRPPATFAAVMMSVALLIDLIVFFAIVRLLMASGSDNYGAIREAADAVESAQAVAIWGMALSLAALLALIHSYREVARDLGDNELAASCVRVGALVAGGAAGAFLTRRWLAGAERIQTDTLLLGGIGVLALLVVMLIAYLSLLGRVKDRLHLAILGVAAPASPLELGGQVVPARTVTGDEIERWTKDAEGNWVATKLAANEGAANEGAANEGAANVETAGVNDDDSESSDPS